MPDPFAARGPVRVASERKSDLESFVERIRRLGAGSAEIAAVREHWDDFNDDWTPERRDATVRLNDAELLAEVRAAADEYDHDTTDDDELAERVDRIVEHDAFDVAPAVLAGTVAQVIARAEHDDAFAYAAVELEFSDDGARRKGILAALGDRHDEWAERRRGWAS